NNEGVRGAGANALNHTASVPHERPEPHNTEIKAISWHFEVVLFLFWDGCASHCLEGFDIPAWVRGYQAEFRLLSMPIKWAAGAQEKQPQLEHAGFISSSGDASVVLNDDAVLRSGASSEKEEEKKERFLLKPRKEMGVKKEIYSLDTNASNNSKQKENGREREIKRDFKVTGHTEREQSTRKDRKQERRHPWKLSGLSSNHLISQNGMFQSDASPFTIAASMVHRMAPVQWGLKPMAVTINLVLEKITLNDFPIWSKLQSGYLPNIQELFQILDNHLKKNFHALFASAKREIK
ncbi:hypothetical protein DNTS_000078, partial [Danionella cerebrum]